MTRGRNDRKRADYATRCELLWFSERCAESPRGGGHTPDMTTYQGVRSPATCCWCNRLIECGLSLVWRTRPFLIQELP